MVPATEGRGGGDGRIPQVGGGACDRGGAEVERGDSHR